MNTNITIPAGLALTIKETCAIVRCEWCGSTGIADTVEDLAKGGKKATIAHTRRCENRDLQVSAAATAKPEATDAHHVGSDFVRNCKDGAAGKYDERDIRLAVACGAITVSDAMNSDF